MWKNCYNINCLYHIYNIEYLMIGHVYIFWIDKKCIDQNGVIWEKLKRPLFETWQEKLNNVLIY